MIHSIIQHLNSEGFPVTEIIPDGKIHRFNLEADTKKSGFYICFQNHLLTSGEQYYVIQYGSWRDSAVKTYSTIKGKISKEDSKHQKEQAEKARKEYEKVKEEGYEIAAKECQEKWDKLDLTGKSEYLENKKIAGHDLGIRFDNFNGDIYVPLRDISGKLWSLQCIDRDGNKRFYPGGRVQGCVHFIGNRELPGQRYGVAEGFATASSVHLATGWVGVCAFSSGALQTASKILREAGNDVVICGDNDSGKEGNPGRTSAERAGKASLCSVVIPKEEGDWNDLICRRGLEYVKNELQGVKIEKHYLLALGYKEKEYFFTSSDNPQIVSVSKFSKSDFYNLMPREYWEAIFPGAGATKVDWDLANSVLTEQARAKGIFESQNIRGAGVWNDAGRIVVNMGDHLLVDNVRTPLGQISSRYFYTLGVKLPDLHPSPLSASECEVITAAAHAFKWKKPDFGFLLAGAMVTTRVCGALPIRPHIWLTGSAGQGKTTLFNRFIYPLIGEPVIFAGGNSTEAGIRQEVCANAVPVLFDEFENQGGHSAERIQSVLDLMRIAWSETKASIIKGGSGGVATSYRARFAAIVTSIRQISMTDADRSRFATLELGAHGSDMEHWEKLDGLLNQIDLEFGNRLFARTIKLLPVLLQNFKEMKKALPGQRFGDQYGMLLAGYALLLQDAPIGPQQARMLAGHVALQEEKEDALVSDQDVALSNLLTTKYSYESPTCRKESLIGDMIRASYKDLSLTMGKEEHASETKALSNLGIRVELNSVAIAAHHSEQSKVWATTHWRNNWAQPLARIPGAERGIKRVNGKSQRCVIIPISHFL